MGLLRRGGLGILLFAAALVLMPILVLKYHPGGVGPHGRTGSPAVSASTGRATTPAALRDFTGIPAGGVVRGTVDIELLVSGAPGTVLFRLSGPTSTLSTSAGPRYLFRPDGRPWDTSGFPNGLYSLTATATQQVLPSAFVTFQIAN